jgi:hypothetical protein
VSFALNRKNIESSYPVFTGSTIGLCLIGIFLLTDVTVNETPLASNISSVLASAAAISGTIVGFLSTALSILFVLSDRPYLKSVSRSGALDDLISYIVRSIFHWVLLAISSITGLLTQGVIAAGWYDIFLAVEAGLLVAAFLSFYRATSLIASLLRKQVGYRG